MRVRTFVAFCIALALGVIVMPTAGRADPQTIEEVREEVERLNHDAVVAIEEYNVAADQLKAVEKELRVIQERAAAQQEELDSLQRELGIYTAMAYRNAGVDETLQLLTTDDPQQFLDQATTLDQLSAQQSDALRDLQIARQELAQTEAEVAAKLAEVEHVSAELKAKKEEIQGKLQRATAYLARLTAEERAKINEPSEDLPADVPASGRAKVVVDFAKAQLGEPYRWAAAGPGSWDCSGLTMMAWREAGVSLPHSSAMQIGYGSRVSKSQLQPGDLVFFYSPISHVGIYIGGGKMIHSPKPGDVVKVTSISYMPFAGASRPG